MSQYPAIYQCCVVCSRRVARPEFVVSFLFFLRTPYARDSEMPHPIENIFLFSHVQRLLVLLKL